MGIYEVKNKKTIEMLFCELQHVNMKSIKIIVSLL